MDHRQLRSGFESDLLGNRASQAVDARQPRFGSGATLYANSTLALNADTGKLAWYHSLAPGETLDLDEVFERVLVDDSGQNLVFSAGKAGILWKLDRKTGKYLGHKEMVFQNVYDSIDPRRASRTIATISSSSAWESR